MSIVVHRAAERFVTRDSGRITHHSFSFGTHYDPANVGFAAMVALNDELLPPGTGYPDHPHRDIEIITLVLSGALHHVDSTGHEGVLTPGTVQRVSAGSGIVHSEVSEPGLETRFLQTWLRPDEPGLVPSFAISALTTPVGLVEAVGPDGTVSVASRGSRLHLGTICGAAHLPDGPRQLIFIIDGRVKLEISSSGRATRRGFATRVAEP